MPFLRVAPYLRFGASSLALSLVACADESPPERSTHAPPALRSESTEPDRSYVVAQAPRCSSRDASPPVLMELGWGEARPIQLADGRLLVGGGGVWDLDQRREIAPHRGKAGYLATNDSIIGGDVALLPGENGNAELRSVRDGAMLQLFDGFRWETAGGISRDGKHVWRVLNDTIKVWTTEGKLLLSTSLKVGHPSGAVVHGNVLRLWDIYSYFQDVNLSDGSLSRSAFEGRFQGWIDTGPDFLTLDQAGLLRVYDGTDGHVRATLQLNGVWKVGVQRGFLWTVPSGTGVQEVRVVRLADLAPVLTFPVAKGVSDLPSNGSVAFYASTTPQVQRLDLTGSEPRVDTLRAPAFYSLDSFRGYLSSPDGRYVLYGSVSSGSDNPAYLTYVGSVATPNELPEPFACGGVTDTAGSSAGRLAVATADGLIRVFDRASPTPTVPILTLAYPSDRLELSGDGRTLLARRMSPTDRDQTLRIFSVPDGKVLQTFPHDGADGLEERASLLSRNGQVVGRRICPAGPPTPRCELLVYEVASGRQVFRVGELEPNTVALSPSGMRVAVASEKLETRRAIVPYYETTVYELASLTEDGAPKSAKVDGSVATFVDEVRFLVTDTVPGPPSPFEARAFRYGGWRIVDTAGKSTSRIWQPIAQGPVHSDGVRIHLANEGAIYDTTTGKVMQSTGDRRSTMVDGLLVDLVNGQLKLTPGFPGTIGTVQWW